MVTLTAAIERIPTDCNEGTYSVPAPTSCCHPFRSLSSVCQETQDVAPYRGLFTVCVKRMANQLR
jgi:hypothetical protein